jgi:hypothetical protein
MTNAIHIIVDARLEMFVGGLAHQNKDCFHN